MKIGWSPSQQESNQYAGAGAGYSDSEQYWMELLAAEIHRRWVEQRTGIPDVVFEKETWQANVAASNAAGVTHHVALHTNAGGGTGAEVFHYPGSVQGARMAQVLYKHISGATDTPDRGVKASSTLGELSGTKAAAVIVEFQFHDSVAGAAEIRKSMKEFASAVVRAMCEFYGKVYTVPAPTTLTTTTPPVPVDAHIAQIEALTAQKLELERMHDALVVKHLDLKTRIRAVLDAG